MNALYEREGSSALYRWHRHVQTRLGNAAVLAMGRCLSRVSERQGHRLGAAAGRLMRHISPRHYRIALANLRLAFGEEKQERELHEIARACYTHLGQCLMEFIRLPRLPREDIKRMAELHGAEHIEAALAQGKGAILLTGHLGNWEIVGARLAAEGYPVVAIARAQRDSTVTDYILRTRQATGMKIYHRESAVRASLTALRSNELVGVLIDQNAGAEGVFVDFFGRLASTASGTAVFALRTDAPVLPTFGYRKADDRHVVMLEPPVPVIRTGDHKQDVLQNTARYTKIVEAKIRAHPEQWFWLHKRWKSRPPREGA